MATKFLKVAAVQAAPVYLDLVRSVDKAIRLIEDAANAGAKLVAFPETWLPGYPSFLWLGPLTYSIQYVPRYHANSLDLGGPEMARLCQAAKRTDTDVVIGYSERAHGSLYMGQSLISRTGEILFSRRKLKPTHAERTLFGEGDGYDLVVATNQDGVRLGALCCWEHFQPLSKFALYSLHEQVHVASWPSLSTDPDHFFCFSPQVNIGASRTYAVEGQCFVLAACAVIDADMVAAHQDAPEKAYLIDSDGNPKGGGFSAIFGPDGRQLSQNLPHREEGMVFADLQLDQLVVAKGLMDTVGHYSRPDVTQLIVRRGVRRTEPTVFEERHAE